MSIVVTGATGQLGRLVVKSLLERGVPAGQIIGAGRDLDKIKDFADQGLRTARIDFDDPAGLDAAFDGAQKVLLISGSEVGRRISQHRNAIDAAGRAGVDLLVYTSIAGADTATMSLADDHKGTEAALRESGLPFALLRNSWYLENYTGQLATTLQRGVIYGSSGEGRISAAARADFAEAAAVVLSTEGQAGAVYELGGDEAFSQAELAAEITARTGTRVEYRDLPEVEYRQTLLDAGLPEPVATLLADVDRGVSRGELLVTTGDLSRLIAHPTSTLADALGTRR